MKVCNVCRASKPPEAFYINRAAPDGRGWTCIACERKRDRRSYQATYDRTRRDRLARSQRDRIYRSTNADAIKRRRAAAYAANRDKAKARAAKWRHENPARKRELGRRDHLRRLIGRSRDADELAYIATLRTDPCAYCGSGRGEIDHIVPVAAGGPSATDNLTAACRTCNASKSATPLLLFLLARLA